MASSPFRGRGAGITLQRTQYYPSGLPWAEGEGASVQNKKYNGKEFIEAHGLDEYDSAARWYYPAIMRTTTLDPLAEKYYSISPYAWCGNNPVNRIDPDGRDYIITINRDKDGNITGIIFSATVYITGDGANPERAVELNALAKKTYKSKEINGVSVGFDVQYKYDKEVTGIGDYGSEKVPYNSGINMLDLKNEKSDRKNGIDSNVQTEVEGSSPYHGSIYNSREKEISNYDIMHETMHFFGFDDRYNAKTFIYNIGYHY